MKNEIEVIDGVKGEWRTVTKPSEVTVGHRVRYSNYFKYGFSKEDAHVITRVKSNDADSEQVKGREFSNNIFDGYWKTIQAFFPLPVRKSRKVAKVYIEEDCNIEGAWLARANIPTCWWFNINDFYTTKKNAIRGAQRFCKAIGYECEIVK